jgi:hypothetical protein
MQPRVLKLFQPVAPTNEIPDTGANFRDFLRFRKTYAFAGWHAKEWANGSE